MLFTYTIGFAHDFIPHYHIEDIHVGVVSEDHHKHVDSDTKAVENVAHGDHIDSGIYDYLVCIFSEANHSNHDIKTVVLQGSNNSIVHQNDVILYEDQFVFVLNDVPIKKNVKVCSKPINDNSSCLSSRSNRRGPPTFS